MLPKSSLSDELASVNQLRAMISRLKQIASDPRIRACGSPAAEYADFVMSSICRTISALQEASSHLRLLRDLPGELEIPERLLSDIHLQVEHLEHEKKAAQATHSNVTSTADSLLLLESTS